MTNTSRQIISKACKPTRKPTPKQEAILNIFKPNSEGISEWISVEKISVDPTLKWGKNGAARHGIFFNDKRFSWEKQPAKGTITHPRSTLITKMIYTMIRAFSIQKLKL